MSKEQHYKELFAKLDKFIDERDVPTPLKHINHIHTPCCGNPKIRYNEIDKVCISCGLIGAPDYSIIKEQFLNPKYQLSTTIGYGGNKAVHRIHKWNNYDYRENAANVNYKVIKDMGEKYI